jgi:hypothetical protein
MENSQNLWRFIRGRDVVEFLHNPLREDINSIFMSGIDISKIGHLSIRITQMRSGDTGIYIDIDIVNSMPSIIIEICKINGYKSCENLEDYVINREEIIEDVMKYYNVTRECVKKLFLRIMMGGSYIKWIEENDVDVMNKEKYKKIYLIEEELKGIREIVYSHNEIIRKIKCKSLLT